MNPTPVFCSALVLSSVLFGCSTKFDTEKEQISLSPGFSSTTSFNGKQLLIGDSLWDVRTGRKLKEFLPQPASAGTGAFSPDGRQVIIANDTPFFAGPTILWNVATGREARRFDGLNGNLLVIQFSPDGSRLLTASLGSREVQIWDVNSGQRHLVLKDFYAATTSGGGLYTSFSPNGREIVVMGWRRITIWNSTTGSPVCTIKQEERGGSSKPDFFVSTQFSPDSKLVLTEQCDGTTKIWEANSGREIRSFALTNHNEQFWPYALFAPNGREVISGADDGMVVLWNVNSGREIKRFQIPGTGWGPVDQMIISRDGKRLIGMCRRTKGGNLGVALWDVKSGNLIKLFDDPYEQIAGFSPVDETFITIRDGKPDQLWDGATGKIIRRYDSSTTVSDVHGPCDILLSGNVLYGMASGGNGAVFKVNTDGTDFEILHGFTAARSPALTNHDGIAPQGMILFGTTLYGTAGCGGDGGRGTVFKVKTNGTDFTVLHSFTDRDGASPGAELVLSGRTLYGATLSGGSGSNGTVFKLDVDGANFTTLHSFTPRFSTEIAPDESRWTNSEGGAPGPGVILSGHTLYGATMYGGMRGAGTVFRVNTDGTGFAVLHDFAPWWVAENPRRVTNSEGVEVAGLVLSGYTLYGVTSSGGVNGQGTLFKLDTNGAGFTVVKSFPSLSDSYTYAFNPGGLRLSGDTLYGKPSVSGGPGRALFKINLDGGGFTMFPIFTNSVEAGPVNAIVPAGDLIYGATSLGGKEGGGIVFKINADGTSLKVIHSFSEKWRLLPAWPSD